MDGESKNTKFTAEQFSKFIHTPRGKAILFFALYLIFFIVLIVVARMSGGSAIGSTELDLKPYSYDLSSVEKGNYNFVYQYLIDGTSISYSGSHYENKSLFTDGSSSYYQDGSLFLVLQNGLWVKSDCPYLLEDLLDYTVIHNLIDSATYVSKTTLATGEEIINFSISTTTLVKLLDGVDVDLDDPVNTIQLKKSETGEVIEVQYDISSYAKYKGLASSSFQLIISYSNFGEIEEIESPQ